MMPSAFRYSRKSDLREFAWLNLRTDVDPGTTAINLYTNAWQVRRKKQDNVNDQEQRGIAGKGMIVYARNEHKQDHAHGNARKLTRKAVVGIGRCGGELNNKAITNQQECEQVERRVHILEPTRTRSASHCGILHAQRADFVNLSHQRSPPLLQLRSCLLPTYPLQTELRHP